EQGIRRGMEQGVQQGMEQGIRAIIMDGLEDRLPQDRILAKLQRHFSLTKEQAEEYYGRFSPKKI
ncbi:MAG TPA: hypothetical protein DF613_11305, partial [Lachnospiraceae bacterium]|nr:hypothetical protein [Lachnospiraceae bacterium]